jgi:methylglutaconyl-CoA hydratase
MSACDFVIAAERTKIGYPETRRGLVAGLVLTFLRRQLRERDIRELLFTGELIDAARAKEIGLVTRVVSPNELESGNRETGERHSGRCADCPRQYQKVDRRTLVVVR